MRVRLVFETEVTNEEVNADGQFGAAESIAADKLQTLLANPDLFTDQIFKETKVLRSFTKKPGVVYGRPKAELV
jgi:hypothetical protein